MHKALYREYRPLIFDDIIGQDHIVKTLKNQIKDDCLNHAYLFCGTRGTGKTTTAKILSRAVNCIGNISDKPCNECETCKSILNSSTLDVVEIDAASNNSVDDIRELRETVKYTPNNSKYKVYIVDEVHMLSQGAFNALLKTLEEPPSHVIFILATTEPNKIPATILSRCQRFDFKRVSIEVLVDRMKLICEKENVSIDLDALRIIALNGQGSVRDSLSILDKCISFSTGKLTSRDVLELLGSSDPSHIFDISRSIIGSDVPKLMKQIEENYMWGKDLKLLVDDIIAFFRSVMMFKIFETSDDIVVLSKEQIEEMAEISRKVEMPEIIRVLGILSELIDRLKSSSNQRMVLELYMMKIVSPSVDNTESSLLKRIENIEKIVEDGRINIISNTTNKGIYLSNSEVEKSSGIGVDSPVQNIEKFDIIDDEEISIIKNGWERLLEEMKKDKKMPLRAFLAEKTDLKYKNEILYVVFNDEFSFAIDRLKENENLSYIKSTMIKVFGINIDLRFILKSDISKISFVKTSSQDNSEKKDSESNEQFLKGLVNVKIEVE